MNAAHLVALRRCLTSVSSRRSALAAFSAGFVAAISLAGERAETDARKHGKHKRQRKHKKEPKPAPPSPPPPPGPSVRVDVTCAGPMNTVAGVDGNSRLAQTFTALTSGSLVSAQLQIEKDTGAAGDYILQLGSVDDFGVPTNAVLAKTTVANQTVPDGTSTVVFAFVSPFSVVTGTQYALVVTRPGAVNVQWDALRGDVCAGRSFQSANQTAPFKPLAIDADLIFITFVLS
jgi:hypothetical protein